MKSLFIGLMLLVAFCLPANAHPAEGQQLDEYGYVYGFFHPASWTQGDLVFFEESAYPQASLLTPMEWYMLAGTTTSVNSSRVGYNPWQLELTSFVDKFYTAFGYIPDQLSLDLIKQVPGYENLSSTLYDLLRNPLTNEWPRLKERELSPGDVYIRPLTQSEIEYYAQFSDILNTIWLQNQVPEGFDDSGCPIKSMSNVYYLCMWGYNGPILVDFKFNFVH